MKKVRGKIAIVLSAGGTRCAYGAGVMSALADHFGFLNPDILISESGGTITAMYFLSGQYEHMERGWVDIPSEPGFISFLKQPVIDIDFLVDNVLKKRFPIKRRALKKNKTNYVVPLTRVSDGKQTYLAPTAGVDLYEVIRASCALPFLYGRDVSIRGVRYVDGGFGSHTFDHVRHAVRMGARKIILIRCSDGPNALLRKFFIGASKYFELIGEKGLARAARAEIKREVIHELPRSVKLVELKSRASKAVFVRKQKRFVQKLFNDGYHDAVKNTELRKLLSNA